MPDMTNMMYIEEQNHATKYEVDKKTRASPAEKNNFKYHQTIQSESAKCHTISRFRSKLPVHQ